MQSRKEGVQSWSRALALGMTEGFADPPEGVYSDGWVTRQMGS